MFDPTMALFWQKKKREKIVVGWRNFVGTTIMTKKQDGEISLVILNKKKNLRVLFFICDY